MAVRLRRWSRWLLWAVLALLGLLATTLLAALLALRGSLPQLDGQRTLPGLGSAVEVQRDPLGVVSIQAGNEQDMARALGFIHAQERYFEMDLMRRSAAGELAELFGPAALPMDRRMRVHRLRARSQDNLALALGDKRAVLEAYRDGVNDGLAALKTRPWPYLLLRQPPRPWTLEDSVLTGLAMYADLQDSSNSRELGMAQLQAQLPPALYALLSHPGSSFDAPLSGPVLGDAVLPDPGQLDLRRLAPTAAPGAAPADDQVKGSNNFAVAGALTADGRAILADDMHLGLRAPNIWFRVRLRYADAQAASGVVDVAGFSLPGLPAVIVGSNGHVAWGFTNSYIDTADFAVVPASERAAVRQHRETLQVAGAAPQALLVEESDWGPLLHQRPDGSALALRWTAQLPGAVRLDFADMARATDLDSAQAIADRSGIPAQNLLLADRHGRIGWRLIGTRPARDSRCPAAMMTTGPDTAHCPAWANRTDQAPQLIDPPQHRLWTANGRVVAGQDLAAVGDGGYDLGARGQQIRDALFAREQFTEADLLAIQLDDRALLMQRWWQLLRQTVSDSNDPALQRLEAASRQWEGHASVDSVSYRLARGFRGITLDTLESAYTAPARAALGKDYVAPRLPQLEGMVWPLLQQRPAHLLPPGHASWDTLLAGVARQLEAGLAAQGPDLAQRTWGERNTTAICHPVSRALPALAKRWLCMPAHALPGDAHLPRVQGPAFGASQRMVVSPGHEAEGIVHMPGGQSGHPLSPFWGAGHDDWEAGRPAPFLPGPALHTLRLEPSP